MTKLNSIYQCLILISILPLGCVNGPNASDSSIPYMVDTLFSVSCGDHREICNGPDWNLRLFAVDSMQFFLMLTKERVFVFDHEGKPQCTISLQLGNSSSILDVCSNPDGLTFFTLDQIYYTDRLGRVVDSVNYPPDCMPGRQFCINGFAYFEDYEEPGHIIEYHIAEGRFSKKLSRQVWGVNDMGCILDPFSSAGAGHFVGASRYYIVYEKHINVVDTCSRSFFISNAAECKAHNLTAFGYDVYPTICPRNSFRFIDDSTAVFAELVPNKETKSFAFYRIVFLQ